MPRQRPASISSSQTSPHRLPNPSIDDDQREDLGDSGSSLHRTRRQPNLEGQGDETVEYAGGSYMWENCSDVELASPSGLNDDCCSDVLVRSEVPSSSPSWWALGGSSGSHGRIQVPTVGHTSADRYTVHSVNNTHKIRQRKNIPMCGSVATVGTHLSPTEVLGVLHVDTVVAETVTLPRCRQDKSLTEFHHHGLP